MPPRASVPEQLKTGPFTLERALAAGLTRRQLRSKSWRRIAPRTYVYAGLRADPLLAIQAAALRLPAEAVFCGMTAAWLHGLDVALGAHIPARLVHDGGLSTRAALHITRADVDDGEIVVRRGFRVTSVERALADISTSETLTEAVVITDMALHAGLTELPKLEAKAAARAGRPGIKRFRQVLELADPRSESPMETRLRLLLVQGGLPRPESQVELRDAAGVLLGRADLYYRSAHLVIEYDGDGHRATLTEDNRRQNRLVEAGFKILRFTAADVYSQPAAVVARVRAGLAAASGQVGVPRLAAGPITAAR